MSGTIVVGTDGSACARLAVRWAAQEAAVRRAALMIVSVWDFPTAGFTFGAPAYSDDITVGIQESAKQSVADGLEDARAVAPGIEVSTHVVQGQAAEVLMDAAREAELLVVGSRGLGGVRELLLGSVSQHCANYSVCPVVVVRHLAEAA